MELSDWGAYLKAFEAFNKQAATKYRRIQPAAIQAEDDKNIPAASADMTLTNGVNKTAHPVEPCKNSPSSVVSKDESEHKTEVNEQTPMEQPLNVTIIGKTEQASISGSLAPEEKSEMPAAEPEEAEQPEQPEMNVIRSESKPSVSLAFSTSTKEPQISNKSVAEISQRDASECSDKVVFRKNWPDTVGATQTQQSKPAQETPRAAEAKETPEPSPVKDIKTRLKESQARVLKRMQALRLGLAENQEGEALRLARDGPGVLPDSEISKSIRARVLALEYPENANAPNPEQMSIVPARVPLTDIHKQRAVVVRLQATGKFNPVLMDWQYRPWNNVDEAWTKRFGDWLEDTMKIGCQIDTTSAPYTDPDAHADGMTGFVYAKFDHPDSYLDESVPGNARSHETVAGYVHNWNLRLEREKAKELQARQIPVVKIAPEPHPFTPKIELYIRPPEPKDIRKLTSIYNYYIRMSVRSVELDVITYEEMERRINQCEAAHLPCLVAADSKPGKGLAMNSEVEDVYGFIIAKEFLEGRNANRYTAELEVFVSPTYYNCRIGRSLIDKMLQICDPKYMAKRGYTFACASEKRGLYCGADVRPLSRFVIVFNYSAEETEEYQRFKHWAEENFGFVEQGSLKGVAVKQQKVLTSAYLVKNTILKPETKGDAETVQWEYN